MKKQLGRYSFGIEEGEKFENPKGCNSFLDIWECYSLNEITIYWNSPAIFVAAFLAADV